MTSGHVPLPVRAVTRRRLAILLPLAVGLVVGAILWRAGDRRCPAPPPGPTVIEHHYAYEPAPPPPPPPMPSADAWAGLERCLREDPHLASLRPPITVADVRHWVEVEHDPTWVEGGVWWLPMSGEGERQMPSGYYVGVPPAATATAPCGGAIIN
ncbi:MAG: hypothetical protein K8M05_25455 [Deltaproteobacteria bacterium]|nr:hypothetical protein [Kofleriaceae bacterium]